MSDTARPCPSCGATNVRSRELCGRCGTGLDGGPTSGGASPNLGTTELRAPRRRVGGLLWAVLGAILAVAAITAAVTLAGLGPFVPGPDVPAATFEAGAYPGDPEPVELSDIATLTTSPGADAEAPAAMADDDPTTAWRSDDTAAGLGGDTPGETIELTLTEPAWIARLVISNGDQIDDESYAASARLRRVRLTFDGGPTAIVDLLDIGREQQQVVLEEPLLTTELRIDVLEAFRGETDELALSELALFGWIAVGDDRELALERAALEPASTATTEPTLGTILRERRPDQPS